MKVPIKTFLVVLLTLFCFYTTNGQRLYQKNRTLYFSLPGIHKNIPYTPWSQEPFQLNDSIVYDIKFKKITRKVRAVSYRLKDYAGDGYASPIEILKYKLGKPKLDTVLSADQYTGASIYKIIKYYTGVMMDSTASPDNQ